ncbi:cytohesin 1 [Pelomyxa schiedti]|nr:cytohesin 1 [Pelomyxa schiedti]
MSTPLSTNNEATGSNLHEMSYNGDHVGLSVALSAMGTVLSTHESPPLSSSSPNQGDHEDKEPTSHKSGKQHQHSSKHHPKHHAESSHKSKHHHSHDHDEQEQEREAESPHKSDVHKKQQKQLLRAINKADQLGRTPMHHAAASGSRECLSVLMGNGGDPNAIDSRGFSVLHYAVDGGFEEIVELLIKGGAVIEGTKPNVPSVFHIATSKNYYKCMELLVKNFPDALLNCSSIPSVTPLHVAATNPDSEILQLLLQSGVPVDVVDSPDTLRTSLHYACAAGCAQNALDLLAKGANPSLKDSSSWNSLHHAVIGGLPEVIKAISAVQVDLVEDKDQDGLTPLHVAAGKGNFMCLEALLQAKACPTTKDTSGALPLHKACLSGCIDCISMLLAYGGAQTLETKASNGMTPLHAASASDNYNAVSFLIHKGATVTTVDNTGMTPLHIASAQGNPAVVKVLLVHGASITAVNGDGITPLHAAAGNGNCALITLLCNIGADVNVQDLDGNTALNYAISNGFPSSVKCLLSKHADTRIVNKKGQTALHVSACVGAPTSIGLVIDSLWLQYLEEKSTSQAMISSEEFEKMKLHQPDCESNSPLHSAIEQKNIDAARILILKGCDPLFYKDKNGKTPYDLALELGVLPLQELESLNKQRAVLSKSRERESPEFQAKYKEHSTKAIQLFNHKPSQGVEYMQKAGLIKEEPAEIAAWLLSTSALNKVKIGEYIGGREQFNRDILTAFIKTFDFTGLEFDIALRRLLMSFRLPGESQVIDRIMEQFAHHYFTQNPTGLLASSDAVYVLAFSVIMLNTDAHSPQVKNKMSKAEFLRNNRGINSGMDVPGEYLEKIYDRIVHDEIKMEKGVFANAEKKGWLTKEGGRIKTWKKRWFVLSDNCLYYFKNPGDKEPCGIVPLENVEVIPVGTKKNLFTIQRISSSSANVPLKACKMEAGELVAGHHDVYHLSADSAPVMEDWLIAINASIHHNPFYQLVQQKTQRNTTTPGTNPNVRALTLGRGGAPRKLKS